MLLQERKAPQRSSQRPERLRTLYRDLASVEKRLANLGRQIADKSKRLHSYEERQARESERERKKLATETDRQSRKSAQEQKRLIREREEHERRVTREVSQRAQASRLPMIEPPTHEDYDFFICHASEDKESLVRSSGGDSRSQRSQCLVRRIHAQRRR